MWLNNREIRDAEELLTLVASALDLAPEVLERIAQVEPRYFEQARQGVLDALLNWHDDHTVPACLSCGSPRVDWVEALAMYRCQDCGAKEERVAQRAAIQGLDDECGVTRRRVA